MTFLLRVNVIERDIYIIRLLAHNHGVTLTKCTTTNILAADPHIEAYIKAKEKKELFAGQIYRNK